MASTTEQLVTASLAGEHAAFGELVRRYERSVLGVCLAVLSDHNSARDACQDTFVVAFERLGQLRDRSAFGGWVLQIARRTSLGIARHESRQRPVDVELLEQVEQPCGPFNAEVLDVLDGIDRLPDHQRNAVLLHYFDHLSVAEVAAATGRSVGTVTKQLTRARQRLRQWFQQEVTR